MAEGEPLLDFLADMRRMVREDPWKQAQTHRSLARYLQEETAETLEAIDLGDAEHLREELGDLLLQVYFHAVIAEESGEFTLDDVVRGIAEKMRRRNPHVFGAGPARGLSVEEVDAQYQAIKQTERPRTSPYDGIGPTLSALLVAMKVLERSPDLAAGLPVAEETARPSHRDRLETDAELGDRLLALVAEAVATGTDPEQALRDALRRRT